MLSLNFLEVSRQGHSFSLKVEHLQNEALCAMHTLLCYMKRTEDVRLTRKVFKSFVTYKAVTSSSLARLFKEVNRLSGVDVNAFKAHSYRGAASSAAYHRGCSMKNILQTADWSSDKNFKKFYYRHSLSQRSLSFANAVFGSV